MCSQDRQTELTSGLLVPFACFYSFYIFGIHASVNDPPDALALKSTSGRLQMTPDDLHTRELCTTQASSSNAKYVLDIIERITSSGNVAQSTESSLILPRKILI